MRILGLDPGTGIFGFGVIDFWPGKTPKMVTAGVIKTPPHTPLAERLEEIYDGITLIIDETKPDEAVIEKLFFAGNITTGIAVSHARGVALLALKQKKVPIYEYTPLQIKQTLTSYGRATKKQIQEMVRIHLAMKAPPKPDDAADALAAAITHSLLRGRVSQEKLKT
ncbi:crossover junction endodeoxyribonuclease RuvC [Candidatus Saccharibacteria bacterium]|nr:crossover junction endodeoxyribonuclease RuvC [Candidatus Saccharibacteria bacterium]